MSDNGGQPWAAGGTAWLLAGAGIATAVSAAWAIARSRGRPPGAVGAHAWLVPTRQARAEAAWTRQALVHASESKHG
jgi:hypothetical protein